MTTATTSSKQANADPPDADTRPSAQLSAQQQLKLLADMMLIRRFEERTMQAYQQAKIGGFCHIYIGQEACAVGSVAALRKEDAVIGAYRDHGLALAKGMHPNYAMAEMFGKVTGCAKGKGGSMHFFDRDNNMFGGHAIVGGQCPLGIGIAWGQQYEGKDTVTLCYLGDGALNQGGFLESMNLAAVYNLPIIFVLENNGYSMGTHINRGTAMGNDLRHKAQAFGMRYAECDGQDVLATFDCFTEQVALTRGARPINYNEKTGKREDVPKYDAEGRSPGPAFINVKTYRYQGHSMSDPQKYRTKDEVAGFQEVDCINRLVNTLIEDGRATQEQIDELDNQAKEAAKEAVKFAEASPDLPMDEMYTDVYVNTFGPYKTGEPPAIITNNNSGE